MNFELGLLDCRPVICKELSQISECIAYLEVEPLAVPVGVEVGPEVKLVVRLAYADGFAQVSRLETGLEAGETNEEFI